MTKKTELLDAIDESLENTKDFNKFIHLFSKDEGKKTLTRLRKLMLTIKSNLQLATIKEVAHPKGAPIK